jgi:hypothetical protein
VAKGEPVGAEREPDKEKPMKRNRRPQMPKVLRARMGTRYSTNICVPQKEVIRVLNVLRKELPKAVFEEVARKINEMDCSGRINIDKWQETPIHRSFPRPQVYT